MSALKKSIQKKKEEVVALGGETVVVKSQLGGCLPQSNKVKLQKYDGYLVSVFLLHYITISFLNLIIIIIIIMIIIIIIYLFLKLSPRQTTSAHIVFSSIESML